MLNSTINKDFILSCCCNYVDHMNLHVEVYFF